MFHHVKASIFDMEDQSYLFISSGYPYLKKTPACLSHKPTLYLIILDKHKHVFAV